MTTSHNVAKSSILLILQQFVLNFISIFATGYIARSLGDSNYGKFVFGIGFVALFTPLTSLGVAGFSTRSIAEELGNASNVFGKILALRFLLAIATFILIIAVIHLLRYPNDTIKVVYIIGGILVINTITITFSSFFQAHGKIEYVATIMFTSGFVLTILSVVILYVGYGLIGLCLMYLFGNIVGLVIAIYYAIRRFQFPVKKIVFDTAYFRELLLIGKTFFFADIVKTFGSRIGITVLSKMGGASSVGLYGAASGLTEKLVVIPDSICTSIFPLLITAYKKSEEDAISLYKRYFVYFLILAMPIAVGTTILSKKVIFLIYGREYFGSVIVLQISAWWLFFTFINFLQMITLNSIHREKEYAKAIYLSTFVYFLINLIATYFYKEIGSALSLLVYVILIFILCYFLIGKYFTKISISALSLIRILLSNFFMAISVYLSNQINMVLAIIVGVLTYSVFILLFKVLTYSEACKVLKMLFRAS
jgi:O-antigen/teichoic acid export membrane protein